MIHYSLPNQGVRQETGGFSAVEILLPSIKMNVAEITLTARYPETGFVINRQSEMVVRILIGSVTLESGEEKVDLSEGFTVLVPVNQKYCWIPHGSVTLYIVSSPPWTPEQSESVSK